MFGIIQKYLYDKENLSYVLDYLIDYKEKNNKKFNIDKVKNYLINLYMKKQNNELTKQKINDKINKLLYYIHYDF
jgi:DNA polymerase II large subunit